MLHTFASPSFSSASPPPSSSSFSPDSSFVKKTNVSLPNSLNCLSSHVVSDSECKYIREGIQLGVRTDGRKLKNFRSGKICHSFISTANGSASYENYENYILAATKFELVSTRGEESEEEGDLSITIDFPTCSMDAVRFMSFYGDDAGHFLCKFIKNFCFSSTFFDKKFLCILPKYFYWNVFIDVVVLRMGGNLLDAVTIAIRAALKNTIIPKVSVYREVNEEIQEKEYQIDVDDQTSCGVPFPCESIPICITAGEINRCYVWDMNAEEECCADCLIIAAVNKNSRSLAMHKSGGKAIEMATLRSVLQESDKIGKDVLQQLDLTFQD